VSALALAIILSVSNVAEAVETVIVDRVFLYFTSPETGGVASPQYISERQLAVFARLEAMADGVTLEGSVPTPAKYVQVAADRCVARRILAALLSSLPPGVRPVDEALSVRRVADEAVVALADRVGGAEVVRAVVQSEGLGAGEFADMLATYAKALLYVDSRAKPLRTVPELELRDAFVRRANPFRGQGLNFDHARARLYAWVVSERMRASELEFLQTARGRIKLSRRTDADEDARTDGRRQ